jgi:undecaprenyl-phosphate 4-deoxy-4-formamido-L-arabinose transferase
MAERSSSLKPGVSVVVPVYNSEKMLEELAQRLGSVMDGLGLDYEIILVNDGSKDQSWQEISRLSGRSAEAGQPGMQRGQVRGINLMRNYGQHNALLCGVRAARFNRVVTVDDDLQHPAGEIPALLAKLDEGHDVVYGTPIHQQHSLWRKLASYVTRLALQSTMGVENARQVSAFRAFRTQLRTAFERYQSPFVILDVLLAWGTTRFTSIPVQHNPRQSGVSNYTFKMLLIHAINMVTGFTVLPLQLASLMGFGFAVFGVLVLFYVIGRYLIQGGSVPGFPFLASIVAIFSGVQLFALGIIGEYLARMHFRIMEKPTYVIREGTEEDANGPVE